MRTICLISFLMVCLTSEAQQQVMGRLLNKSDSSAISGAILIDVYGRQTLTDSTGWFTLEVVFPAKVDYIHINFAGTITITDTIAEYYLEEGRFDLNPAIIKRYSRRKFDREFIYDAPPDTSLIVKKKLYLERVDRTPRTNGVELGSPITFLYNRYSKQAKRRRAYEEVMMRRRQVDLLRSMLREGRLVEILNTTDPETLECFFLYCSIDPRLVLQVPEAHILQRAKDCAESYEHQTDCPFDNDLYFIH